MKTPSLLPILTAPLLGITAAGSNVVLSWPACATTFNPQAIVQTPPTASCVFLSNFTGLENGQFIVTDSLSDHAEFFRLLQFGP